MSNNPKSWFKVLHLAEYWFNSSYHSAIGIAPFRALYGRHPPNVLAYVEGSTDVDEAESPLLRHHHLLQQLRITLRSTRQSM